jgi:hypothetical protein
MPDPSTETQIALLIAGQKSLVAQVEDIEDRADKKIAVVEAELAALRQERDKALRWGVASLGGAVMALAAFITKHIPWSGT